MISSVVLAGIICFAGIIPCSFHSSNVSPVSYTHLDVYKRQHPYNAAMMFADGFDVDPYVALRTIYMKTVAEGRTITWHFSEKNIENFENYYTPVSYTHLDVYKRQDMVVQNTPLIFPEPMAVF